MPDENGYPTIEETVAEVNRYATPQVAALFKVNEPTVEQWKGGDLGFGGEYGIVRNRMVEVLREKGTPAA
jgi:hypothetical protein